MIQIAIHRIGLIVVATTANDFGDITLAWGFTAEGARRRLLDEVSA